MHNVDTLWLPFYAQSITLMHVNYNLQITTLFISPICFIALVFSTRGIVETYKKLYNYTPKSCKNPIETIIICQGAKVVSKLAYKNYNYMPRSCKLSLYLTLYAKVQWVFLYAKVMSKTLVRKLNMVALDRCSFENCQNENKYW